jgi:hypothetical protein
MTFVNLPPNLQDIFGSITDRVAKLETGPSEAMYTADTAQTTAVNASAQALDAAAQAASASAQALTAQTTASTAQGMATIASAQAVSAQAVANTAYLAANVASAQAITAQNTANSASSQATVAQSTASFAQSLSYAASAQATSAQGTAALAQTTADGKNTVFYSLSTPGSTANTAGDIWFQYSGSGLVIAQYIGLGTTSWQQQTITQAVIGTLDAGKITTGTLSAISIDAGTGGTKFNVTAAGYMSAQGAYIKGNITADSGTFNGQVNALSGYFGSNTNGWQINSGGIAGLGSGYISGGAIQGTSFNNGSGTFYVNSSGDLVAQSVYIKGAVLGTSGYFGNVSNGWQIDATGITGIGSGYIAGGAIQGTSFNNGSGTFLVTSAGALTATSATITGVITATSGSFTGTLTSTAGNIGGWKISSDRIYTGASSSSPDQAIYSAGGALFTGTVTVGSLGTVTTATIGGNLTAGAYIYNTGYPSTTGAANMRINTTSGLIAYTSSSARYKVAIEEQLIPAMSIFSLIPKSYVDKVESEEKGTTQGLQRWVGLIAEDVAQIPVLKDLLVEYNAQGEPNSIYYDRIGVALIPAIQDLNNRLLKLEGK